MSPMKSLSSLFLLLFFIISALVAYLLGYQIQANHNAALGPAPALKTFVESEIPETSHQSFVFPGLSEERTEFILRIRSLDENLIAMLSHLEEQFYDLGYPDKDLDPATRSQKSLNELLQTLNKSHTNADFYYPLTYLEGEDLFSAIELMAEHANPKNLFSNSHSKRVKWILAESVKLDPMRTLELIESFKSKPVRHEAQTASLTAWIEHDPETAFAWIDTNHQDLAFWKEDTLRSLFRNIDRAHLERAVAAVNETNLTQLLEDAQIFAGERLLEDERIHGETLGEFLVTLPNDVTALFAQGLGHTESFTESMEAAKIIALDNPQAAQIAYESIARERSKQFPGNTAEWALTLDETLDPLKVLEASIQTWASEDAAAAERWLNTHAENPIVADNLYGLMELFPSKANTAQE